MKEVSGQDGIELSYTADRSAFKGAIMTLGLLAFFELSAIIVLIFFMVDDTTDKVLAISGILILMGTLPVFVVTSTLRSRHRLEDGWLELHYGFTRLCIDMNHIQRVSEVHEPICGFQPLTASLDEDTNRLTMAFSERGQLLLTLSQPYSSKRFDNIEEILINLDHPELLKDRTNSQETKASDTVEIKQTAPKELNGPIAGTGDPNAATMIQASNLTRRFGDFTAVAGLNLSIRKGEIYGFLGCNGSGKTTTIKMMVGLLKPHDGSISLGGYNVWERPLEARATFGYVPDRALLYDRLTGREYLDFIGQMRGLPLADTDERIQMLLEFMDLTEKADRPCGKYSFGMKQKLSLAAALLHQPEVLILDEPFNGLDPRSSRKLKDFLAELAASGMTILMSTHDLATAQSVCGRVGILHGGVIVAEGSSRELQQMTETGDLESVFLQLTEEGGMP